MRYAGSSSWQVRSGTSQQLVIGLFVRDAAGLRPRVDIEVPPLVPAVEARASLAPLAVPEASAQWARWWDRELTRHEEPHRGFLAPESRFGGGEELGALMRECFDDAVRWSSARGREYAEAMMRGDRRGHEGDLVRAVETELGRKARPFELQVMELPVAGAVGWRVSEKHVVVSRALREDAEAYRRWLTSVIRELA
ncbi:hypothetical protein [Streptomyces sp. NPDC001127]|uniref:hypothetical protein n=1 Tax=Streptomyces sp. NPDC001127 TaxID=3154377 RepID=UPI003320386F